MTVLRSIDEVVEVIERVADAAGAGGFADAAGSGGGAASSGGGGAGAADTSHSGSAGSARPRSRGAASAGSAGGGANAGAAALTHPRVIVGIAGSPGAGKSTIAAAVVERLDSAALLPMDGYHLPQATLVALGRRDRMGAPDTFDVAGFVRTLVSVRNSGVSVLAPGFNREIEEPVPDAIAISPELRTVVVEGNYLLHDAGGWEAAAPHFDLTFFIDLDRDIRLSRLIERHVRFGKDADAARAWSLGPDESNARLIEATAPRATHIIRLE